MTQPSAPPPGQRQAGQRQIIESYGGGRFRVSGTVHVGSILVLAARTLPWPVVSADQVTVDSLGPIIDAASEVELLLLGLGPQMGTASAELRAALKTSHIVVEAMDTGAACRTFNVLMAEDRLTAAALIAV